MLRSDRKFELTEEQSHLPLTKTNILSVFDYIISKQPPAISQRKYFSDISQDKHKNFCPFVHFTIFGAARNVLNQCSETQLEQIITRTNSQTMAEIVRIFTNDLYDAGEWVAERDEGLAY